jgi:hypothetical protein
LSETDYDSGFERGYEDAATWIEDHPHGQPVSSLRGTEQAWEPEHEFERGERDGWEARMKEEGWPTSLKDFAS